MTYYVDCSAGNDNGIGASPATAWKTLSRANKAKLQPGDQVVLYTQQRQYTYVVDRTAIVEPTAVEVMASTGSPTVTLISCYPYLVNDQRIVVFGRLQN